MMRQGKVQPISNSRAPDDVPEVQHDDGKRRTLALASTVEKKGLMSREARNTGSGHRSFLFCVQTHLSLSLSVWFSVSSHCPGSHAERTLHV